MVRLITPPMPGPYDQVDVTREIGLYNSMAGPGCECFIRDMVDSIHHEKTADYVTGPNIGYPSAGLVLRTSNDKFVVMLNLEIVKKLGRSKRGFAYKKLRIKYTAIDGRRYTVDCSGIDLERLRGALDDLGVAHG